MENYKKNGQNRQLKAPKTALFNIPKVYKNIGRPFKIWLWRWEQD